MGFASSGDVVHATREVDDAPALASVVDRGWSDLREHRRLPAAAYDRPRERCGSDTERFAREWEERAQTWDFHALNDLIRQHNEWYPVERDLPMDPRTGDYVLVHGRTYEREIVGAEWSSRRSRPRGRTSDAALECPGA
ncbi:MAG: hypothetical protein WKF96_22525 [Solirubrobacteraceae bacterium]